MAEKENCGRDYFNAHLEGGSLIMEPHCACGNPLLETYFCEKCSKQCLCTDIVCNDEITLEFVKKFINDNPRFRNFRARITPKKT